MELTHIEHLGIAVKSIEACLPYYEEVLGQHRRSSRPESKNCIL